MRPTKPMAVVSIQYIHLLLSVEDGNRLMALVANAKQIERAGVGYWQWMPSTEPLDLSMAIISHDRLTERPTEPSAAASSQESQAPRRRRSGAAS